MLSTRLALLLSIVGVGVKAFDTSAATTFERTFCSLSSSTSFEPDTLCIFNSSDFSHRRGLSILTTEYTYSHFHTLDAIRDYSSHSTNSSTELYDVVPLPGKGLGVVAKKQIEPGTMILAEHPSILIHYLAWEKGHESLYESLAESLPPSHKQRVMALDGVEQGGISGIVGTNSFQINLGGEPHKAVFESVSRFNHDCRPNVEYVWDQNKLTMFLRAARTIEPGEEITISYVSQELPSAHRQASLHHQWGFKCTCHFCSLSKELKDASDHRVAKMDSLLSEISLPAETTSTKKLEDILSGTSELLTLARIERLDYKIPQIYSTSVNSLVPVIGSGNLTEEVTHERTVLLMSFTARALTSGLRLYGDQWIHLEDMSKLFVELKGYLELPE